MNLAKIRYYVFKTQRLLIGAVLILLLGAGLFWLFYIKANPMYGKLARPQLQGLTVGKPIWATNNLSVGWNFRAGVGKVVGRKFTVDEAFKLSKNLALTGTSDFLEGNTLRWKNSNKELYINIESGAINYKSYFAVTNLESFPTVNKANAASLAKKFLQENGLDSALIDFNKGEFEYLLIRKTSDHAVSTTESQANMVAVKFPLIFKGKRIVGNAGPEFAQVSVNNKQEIATLSFNYLDVEDEEATYPLISEGVIRKTVSSGKAVVVRYIREEFNPIANPTIVSISKGSLAFLNDLKGSHLQPIYVFKGMLSRNLVSEPIEVYLPAISEKYLKD